MTAIDRIREKFWAQMPATLHKLDALLDRARQDDVASTEGLGSLIHTSKGEAQLLGLEPCATLLETADRLVKATRGPRVHPASTLDALDQVRAALAELTSRHAGGPLTTAAITTLESALERLGVVPG